MPGNPPIPGDPPRDPPMPPCLSKLCLMLFILSLLQIGYSLDYVESVIKHRHIPMSEKIIKF